MGALLKNRVLNEVRFFLNKSNSKWISVGIVPGYHDLNNTGFSVEIKIGGETGSVPLTVNGLKSVISLFKGISYFSKFGPASSDIVLERGILLTEFQMGGSPCYKVINQSTNASVCIGLKSVEELLENEEILWGMINNIDVKAVETEFLAILEKMSKNWDDFFKKAAKKPGHLEGQLLLNFSDFIMTCIELRRDRLGITGVPVDNSENNDDEQTLSSSPPPTEPADSQDNDDNEQAPPVKRYRYAQKYMIQK